MKKIIVVFITAVTIATTLCSCAPLISVLKTEKRTEQAVQKIVNIELDCYTATLKSGETLQLNATYNGDYTLKWKSSDQDVALVNSKGTVTAIGEGVTNITCYDDDSAKAVCTITVQTAEKNVVTEAPADNDGDFIFPHSSTAYPVSYTHLTLPTMAVV